MKTMALLNLQTLRGVVLLVLCGVALPVISHAAGAVTLDAGADLFADIPGPIISTDGTPANVMVMPITVLVPGEAGMDKEKQAEYRKEVWRTVEQLIDASDKFVRVAAPEGAEADEIVQKTMAHAAGMLSATEFKKVKSFKLPGRFVYGLVNVLVEEQEKLRGFRAQVTKVFHAEAQLRLVESKNFTYLTATASSKDKDMSAAVEAAISSAINKYRVIGEAKRKPTEERKEEKSPPKEEETKKSE